MGGKTLISATITQEAYECYTFWAKERRASEKISESILLGFGRLNAVEHLEKWREEKLPKLMRSILAQLTREQWFEMKVEDREAIIRLSWPQTLGSAKKPWELDDDPLGDGGEEE